MFAEPPLFFSSAGAAASGGGRENFRWDWTKGQGPRHDEELRRSSSSFHQRDVSLSFPQESSELWEWE